MDRVTDDEDNVLTTAETRRRKNLVDFAGTVDSEHSTASSSSTPNAAADQQTASMQQQLNKRRRSSVRPGEADASNGASNDDDSAVFETQLVMVFANTVPHKALHWLVDKIRGKRAHGGAELLVRMQPQSE